MQSSARHGWCVFSHWSWFQQQASWLVRGNEVYSLGCFPFPVQPNLRGVASAALAVAGFQPLG